MDIALVFHGCHRRGGVERSVWELAQHLSNRHQVTVYAQDIDAEGLDGVDLVRLPLTHGTMASWRFARSARGALAGTPHDHVVSFGIGDVKADVLWVNSVHRAWLQQSLRFSGGPGVTRYPAMRYLSPNHLVRLAMERHYFTRGVAQSVVAVADAVGEDLQRLYGVSADLMTTIHNGFSPAEFSPERRHLLRSDVRAEFGYAESDVVALFAANELVRKGFDVLVEALAAVAQPRLQVLVVGRAPLTATQLGRLQALGLADRVTHAGTSGDMGRMHAAADLFVLPTQYEAFALAIVEALASGLPVITTEVPGAQDRIIDGTNGRLLRDPRSSAELAGLLRESMEPNRRSGWGDHAPGSVADLTWSSLTGQAELLLESLPLRII